MSVYQKPPSLLWYIDFVIEGVTYRNSPRTTDKAEALKIENDLKMEIRAQIAKRRTLSGKDCTFGEAADTYWQEHGRHTRAADALDSDLERIVLLVGPLKMCSAITRADERRIRGVLRAGERAPESGNLGRPLRTKGKYAAKTINDTVDLMGRVLTYVEESLDTSFPYRRPNKVSSRGSDREIERPRHRHMSFEEQWRLEKVMDPDLTDMVHFAIETGMRSDALCSLRWGQIGWSQCTVTFMLKAEGQESEEKPHTVDLTVEAMAILYRRLAMHHEERVGSDHVFMLRSKREYWYNNQRRLKGQLIAVAPFLFLRRFKAACEKIEIVDLNVHDFRRTAGRRIYDEEGSDIEAARALLGHSDIKQTQNYLGVTGTAINSHLRRRSARTKLTMTELNAAAKKIDAVPGSRAYALRLVLLGEAGVREELPPTKPSPRAVSSAQQEHSRHPSSRARRLSSRT